VVESRATRILAFVAGEFDMTFPTDVSAPLLKDATSQAARAVCELAPTYASTNLCNNRERAPCNDPRVRKALALALDRKAFIDILSAGNDDIAAVMLPPPVGARSPTAAVCVISPGRSSPTAAAPPGRRTSRASCCTTTAFSTTGASRTFVWSVSAGHGSVAAGRPAHATRRARCAVLLSACAGLAAAAGLPPAARAETRELITGQAAALDATSLTIAGSRVRIWGIDAPQSGSWCFRNGAKWRPAADATAGLSTCLNGKTITCRVQKRELHWWRAVYVAECWAQDGQDLGDCMVQAGWATDYTCYSDGYYRDRETEAQHQGVGLWTCDNGPPTRRWGSRGKGAPCEIPPYRPSGPGPR
jgi:endonuclease YncB( thermonuclease family)